MPEGRAHPVSSGAACRAPAGRRGTGDRQDAAVDTESGILGGDEAGGRIGCISGRLRYLKAASGNDYSPFFRYRCPGLVGVEALHFFEFGEGGWPEVFLVYNAVLADDKGLYAGYAVFGRRGGQGEAPDHHTL